MAAVPPLDIIIMPIHSKTNLAALVVVCKEIEAKLVAAGMRAAIDCRDSHKPHWKFQIHIDAGVPLRLEIGERDIVSGQAPLVRCATNNKSSVALDNIVEEIKSVLGQL